MHDTTCAKKRNAFTSMRRRSLTQAEPNSCVGKQRTKDSYALITYSEQRKFGSCCLQNECNFAMFAKALFGYSGYVISLTNLYLSFFLTSSTPVRHAEKNKTGPLHPCRDGP